MHADIATYLRCPLCTEPVTVVDAAVRCPRGHAFDVARQGYVNLLTNAAANSGDTAAMVSARADLLDAGHFRMISTALAEAAGGYSSRAGLVLDAGAGTGHHLAAVLDRLPHHRGLALDLAKPAAKRAARAHPRAGAVLCDTWRSLPVVDACADVIINVFAPRNGMEFARVLRPDGLLLVVTPEQRHLCELVSALGLIRIDPRKDERLAASLGRWFRLDRQRTHTSQLSLSRAEVARLVAMGPSAWHTQADQVTTRLAELREPVAVSLAVRLSWLRRHQPGSHDRAARTGAG